jgi:hypothetical protein
MFAGGHDDRIAIIDRDVEAGEEAGGDFPPLVALADQFVGGEIGEIVQRLDALLAERTSISSVRCGISASASSTPRARRASR